MLTSCLDPGVAVSGSADLVWQVFKVVLRGLVVKSSADETLGGEESVFWVCYSLVYYLN